MCGLRLEAIASELAVQNPSAEMAALSKRRKRAEMLGVICLSTAGGIGLMVLICTVFYYKLLLLGPELLLGSAGGAVILFLLASILFFCYPKFFIKVARTNESFKNQVKAAIPTNKLLNDPPFEPASVTEHSTELLRRKP